MSILFCSITKKLFFIFLCSYRCFLGNFLFIKKFVVIMKIYAITTFFEISLHYTHIFSLLFIWRRNNMGILCDLIVSAKDKNKDSLMEIINKFRPLIKKQAYALNYEDAENDLIVDMIELIYNMPFFQHDGQAVTYISTSIRHSYVKFLKQRIRLRENECIYDPDIIKNIENLSEDFEKKDLNLIFAIRKLNYNQKWVIIYKFFFMFKDKEIMNKLNISRQAVYNNKNKALKNLRKMLEQ